MQKQYSSDEESITPEQMQQKKEQEDKEIKQIVDDYEIYEPVKVKKARSEQQKNATKQ
jgi:hypothetical protein